jgi:hypothetical protein
MSKNERGEDPDKLLLDRLRSEFERAKRSDPELAQAMRRAAMQLLPDVRSILTEILARSADPEETAKAAASLEKLDSIQRGGVEA